MQCLLVADLHANLAAFRAVLDAASGHEEIWCLGDLVGYGPDPNECIEVLREYRHVAVAGNHDWAAVGRVPLGNFNVTARAAVEWTAANLRPENARYLHSLPTQEQRGEFTLVHGSLRSPIWEYVDESGAAWANLKRQQTRYCLVGHTHVPALFLEMSGLIRRAQAVPLRGELVKLSLGESKAILNPGSVGQPRDGDDRAAFALLDTDTGAVELHRVEYPVAETQNRILEAGLPERNAFRLGLGR
mgnify:CR=1 FL=1